MSEGGSWPDERSAHAACCLNYGQQHPQVLVTGEMNTQGKVLGDAWVLDVDSGRLRKVRLNCAVDMYTKYPLLPPLSLQMSGTLEPRRANSTTAFCLVDGVTEVTMFGGSADPYVGFDEEQSKLADTASL